MKKLLFTSAICIMLLALALTLAACDTDTDTGGATTTTTANTQYTVTFVADGDVVATRTYTVGDTGISAPDVPEKAHYNGAWENYTLDGGNKTVNAVYTPIEYTVTFVANGETVDTRTYTVEDKNVNEPVLPAPYGYYVQWEDYTLDCGNKTVNSLNTLQTQAKYILNGSTYYIRGYNKIIDGKIEILSEYNGKPVTSIGSSAFKGCTSLTSITIPSSVTSIGNSAFSECTGLKSIEIPSSVTSIGNHVFSECTNLKSIEIPSSVTSIGDYVFDGCASLTSVTIPSGVTSISNYAFYGCYHLTSITIPSSVTSIGSHAFKYCYNLVEVYNLSKLNIRKGRDDNGYVGYFALNVYTPTSGESKLSEDENGFIIYTDVDKKMLVGYNGDNTDITIPDNITKINQYAFIECTSLKSITIPSSVTSIGYGAFANCYKLVEVYNLSTLNITKGSSSNGYVGCYALGIYTDINTPSKLSEDKNGLVIYTDGNKKILVGYNGDNTDITIPDGITEINKYAFYRCTSLISVTFGENSQLTGIGYRAFYNCKRLESITIPSSVTSIGEDAFFWCPSLTSVAFENPDGWWYASSSTATSGTAISSTDLSNPATAAKYLETTYLNSYWKRS